MATKISDQSGDLGNDWAWEANDAYLSAGGLTSDISDMLTYAQMQLNDPRFTLCHESRKTIHASTESYRTIEMAIMEKENMELTLDEMQEVNGGYIVDRGFWSRYWIVSDYTGNVIDTALFKIDANAICETRTISNYVISEETYNDWMDREKKGLPGPFTHLD